MSVIPFNPGSAAAILVALTSRTTDYTSDEISGTDKFSALNLQIKVANIAGTSPTLNVYIQQRAADGSTWYDIASLTQITANGSYICSMVSGGNSNFTVVAGSLAAGIIRSVPFGGHHRFLLDLGGTNSSMDITIAPEYIE